MVKPRHRKPDRQKFYVTFGALALAGVAAIAYLMSAPGSASTTTVDPVPVGEVKGYVVGSPTAPIEIAEYADFECPGCAQFATVTEPDVRTRIVDAGLARFRFYDFPLPQHTNSMNAHLAAACANDQGKFWPMHDRLFLEQDKWNSIATKNPKRIFASYAKAIGVDEDAWDDCYDSRRHVAMIQASIEQGNKQQIRGTPTFIIGDKMINEVLSYDKLKGMVEAATVEQNKSLKPVPSTDRPPGGQ